MSYGTDRPHPGPAAQPPGSPQAPAGPDPRQPQAQPQTYAEAQPQAQPQQQPPQPRAQAQPQQSAWWNPDAPNDPWRNPASRAVIETHPAPGAPPIEPLPQRPAPVARPGLGLVVAVSAIVSLIAGTLGAAVGVWATRTDGASGTISGAQPQVERDADSVAGVVESIMPSVVTVLTAGGGNGSGFIVSEDGYILTNHHVVAAGGSSAADELQVLFNNGEVETAEVVGSDPTSDVGVLKLSGGEYSAMVLADSDQIAVGDPVLAVGAPLGLASTVTDGIISAIDRPVITENESGQVESVMAAIQTDAAINPGNSGGPLTDIAGQVIGINTAIASTATDAAEAGSIGIGFAIPINQAKRIADEIIETGEASQTVLGAELGSSELGVGVAIDKVVPDSPADEAGLQDGDVLTSFDGKTVTDNTQLVALVRKLAPGTTVTVVYERDGQENSAQVTLAASSDLTAGTLG